MAVTPYLTFAGSCEAAMTFYADVLGAKIGPIMRFKDMPEDMPPEIGDLVAHVDLTLPDGSQIFASDTFDAAAYKGIEGIALHIACTTPEDATEKFATLSEGGTVAMPLDKTFWSEAFGVCRDRFGVGWMVDCSPEG